MFAVVPFEFNFNLVTVLASLGWCLQGIIGILFMMYVYKNHEIEKLEALWKEYRFDMFVRGKCPLIMALIPALYPALYTAINVIIFSLQATGLVPGQILELGINFKGPYLNAIFTVFSAFAWGSCQGLYFANVKRYKSETFMLL